MDTSRSKMTVESLGPLGQCCAPSSLASTERRIPPVGLLLRQESKVPEIR